MTERPYDQADDEPATDEPATDEPATDEAATDEAATDDAEGGRPARGYDERLVRDADLGDSGEHSSERAEPEGDPNP